MSETTGRVDLTAALAGLYQAVTVLQTLDLTSYADDEVLAALRAFETLRRRLEPVDHALTPRHRTPWPARAHAGP